VTDAFLSIIHVGSAGMCRIDCVEMDELGHPMHVVHRGIVQDTDGAGTFREAPSIYGEFGPIEGCTMKVLNTADGQ
jgi:N-methylhydantoinase B